MKHGDASRRGKHHAEYRAWVQMKYRCLNPRCSYYARYGGRGITICDRWEESFETFLADMGPKPSRSHTLDRIDCNGPYSPDNCRWATWKEQERNRRDNVLLTMDGKTLSASEWAESLGVPVGRIYDRLEYGWSVERALTEPVRRGGVTC